MRLASGEMPVDRNRERLVLLGLLVCALLLVGLFGLASGAYPIDLKSAFLAMWSDTGARTDLVFTEIRLPRVVFGMLVGAALGGSGAALQVMFRNPLADPGLIGISSGAALGAVSVIVLGERLFPTFIQVAGVYAMPVAAFFGAVVATVLAIRIGNRSGQVDVAMMLLAGIAINATAQAGVGVLTVIADDQQLRSLSFWTLGSLAIAGWSSMPIIAASILPPMLLMIWYSRSLNRLLLGEVEATHLGVDVRKLKRMIVLCVALSVGIAVSFAGAIGFVGLVVPHLIRLVAGPDNRIVVPGSVLLGAAVTVMADIVARTVVIPEELPVGLILGAVGGPFFLWLIVQRRRRI